MRETAHMFAKESNVFAEWLEMWLETTTLEDEASTYRVTFLGVITDL